MATSDLAKEAAIGAMRQAGITPDDIGFIVVGTTTPDTIFPSTACLLQHKIGAHHAWGFDLGAACSGFTYALTTARQMVATGARDHALVVGADVMSSIIDYTDRTTCVLFGDGAGAVVLAPADEAEPAIIDFAHEMDGSGGPALCMPAGGSRHAGLARDRRQAAALRQAGRRRRCSSSPCARPRRSAARLLERNGLDPSRARPVRVPPGQPPHHSGGGRAARPAGSKVVINLERYGNTTAATIPLALADAVAAGRLKKGDLVLLASVGAGFTVGAVLLRWSL